MARYPRNVELPRYAEYRGGLERNNEGKWVEYSIARALIDRLEADNSELRNELRTLKEQDNLKEHKPKFPIYGR